MKIKKVYFDTLSDYAEITFENGEKHCLLGKAHYGDVVKEISADNTA